MVCDARKLHTTSHVTSTWFEHRHCAITHLRIRFFRSPNVLRFLFHISSSFSAGKTRARLGIFRGRKEERKTRWKRREGGKEPLIRGFARWWAFLLLLSSALCLQWRPPPLLLSFYPPFLRPRCRALVAINSPNFPPIEHERKRKIKSWQIYPG